MTVKISGIYFIKNKHTGQLYIGQSVDIHKRWKSHISSLKKGTHSCYKLQDDWILYGGGDAFEFGILRECTNEELDYYEQLCLDRIPHVILYNVMTKVGQVPNKVKRAWYKKKRRKST